MSKKWYGSIDNRIEEGRNYNKDKLIHEGDDITMYYYSDRTCYYITKVENQKSIYVKKYEVVADKEKTGGMGHQNWLYFKTRKEANEYMNKYLTEEYINKYGRYDENPIEDEEEHWVYRYNKWMRVNKNVDKYYSNKYYNLSGKISFGVRDYYYDWSF